MRIVSLLMVLLMLVMVLTSCETQSKAAEKSPFEQRFAREHIGYYLYVIVDKITGVCYLSYSDAGITVLMEDDGTPLTYSEAWHQMFGEEAEQ